MKCDAGSIWKRWSGQKITNEEVIQNIPEKRMLLNSILCRKSNWIVHILRRKRLLHVVIEGQMMEVEGVRRTKKKKRYHMAWFLIVGLHKRKGVHFIDVADVRERIITTKGEFGKKTMVWCVSCHTLYTHWTSENYFSSSLTLNWFH